jgi:hypothetical protein
MKTAINPGTVRIVHKNQGKCICHQAAGDSPNCPECYPIIGISGISPFQGTAADGQQAALALSPPNEPPFIRTHSGRKFPLLDPDPTQVDIKDISYALANLCRFTGQCLSFYSVAEHSIRVAFHAVDLWTRDNPPGDVVRNGLAVECFRAALLHDAAAAYLGDMSGPLKRGSNCGHEFKRMERRIVAAIYAAFEVNPEPYVDYIRAADRTLLVTEMRDLMSIPVYQQTSQWDYIDANPLGRAIFSIPRAEARSLFLNLWYGLSDPAIIGITRRRLF